MSHTPTPEEREMLTQLARDCGVARDYRKEAYIAAWAGARAANGDAFQCREAARAAVAHFDEDWADSSTPGRYA